MACYDMFMNNLSQSDLTTLGMLPLALFHVMCTDEQGTITSSDLQKLATFIGAAAEQSHLAPAITAVGADLPSILKALQMLNAVDYPDRLSDASVVLFQLSPPMSNSYKKSLIDFANDLVSKPRTPRQQMVLRSILQTFL